MLPLILALAAEEPRELGLALTSNRPLIELQSCISRKMAHDGTPLVLPVTGGVDIDLIQRTMFGASNDARLSVSLRDRSDQREISFRYRHPLSAAYVRKYAAKLTRACFPAGASTNAP